MANTKYYGTGRRKSSVARVYLVPGTGKITVNKRDIDEYFGLETLKVIVRQPLTVTETADKFDVLVNVKGGGYTGQAGAIRHGIAIGCGISFDIGFGYSRILTLGPFFIYIREGHLGSFGIEWIIVVLCKHL